jgi:RNA polymerase sigma-70 factor (ECF subfamily)
MNDPRLTIDGHDLLAHAGFARRLARGLLDEHAADDVVQEVWLAAVRRPPRVRIGVRAWLAGAVRRVAAQSLRGEARRRRREATAAVGEALPATDAVLEHVEILERIVAAVKALDEPHREAIVLRFFADLPAAEIARRLELPETTVRTRLARALALLRERLDREHGGDRRAWCLALLPFVSQPAASSGGVIAAALKGVLTMSPLMKVIALTILAGAAFLPFALRHDPADPARLAPAVLVAASPAAPEPSPAPVARAPVVGPVEAPSPDRDLDLFGQVANAAGAPVEDALVETILFPWWRVYVPDRIATETAPGPHTQTAADGSFAVRLTRGQLVNLRVTASGHATTEICGCYAGEQVSVRLAAPVSLTVKVTDEHGAAVPGARVKIGRSSRKCTFNADLHEGDTGSDGTCVFTGLAPGGAWVTARRAQGSSVHRDVALAESGATAVEITLPIGREIRGVVSDASSSAPIAGATVRIDEWAPPVTTGADGSYVLSGWLDPYGVGELHVAADGHGGDASRPPAEGPLDFALSPADTLHARVLDADGAAVANALVCAISEHAERGRGVADSSTAKTAADGNVTLSGLRRDLPHTVLFLVEGHARLLLDVDPHADGPGVIELGDVALPRARAIEGKALRQDGTPFVDGRVILTGHNGDRGRLRPSASEYATKLFLVEARGVDDLGRFRFPDLPPGSYSLQLETSDGSSAVAVAEPSADRDVLDVILQPDMDVAHLLVVDASGAPLPGAEVVSISGYGITRARTDASGRVDLRGRADDELHLHASRAGYISSPYTDARPQGQEVRLELVKGAAIDGVVVDFDGKPLEGMNVSVRGAQSSDVYTDAQGRFTLLVTEGSTVDLEVLSQQTRSGTVVLTGPSRHRGTLVGVTPPAAGVVIQTALLPADRTLTVLVLDPEGDPAANITVTASGYDLKRTATTGADGLVSLDGLPDEVSLVTALPGDGLPETTLGATHMHVEPNGQRVTMNLREGIFVSGRVLDPDGHAVAGVAVTIHKNPPPAQGGPLLSYAGYGPDTEIFQGTTDADGRFRIVIAPPDKFDVWVTRSVEGGRKQYGDARGLTDPSQEVTIQLR